MMIKVTLLSLCLMDNCTVKHSNVKTDIEIVTLLRHPKNENIRILLVKSVFLFLYLYKSVNSANCNKKITAIKYMTISNLWISLMTPVYSPFSIKIIFRANMLSNATHILMDLIKLIWMSVICFRFDLWFLLKWHTNNWTLQIITAS